MREPSALVRVPPVRQPCGVIELIIGVALGTIVTGFVAIGSYERGVHDATYRGAAWRAELRARRSAERSSLHTATG